jgi:hypothetical protein
LKNLPFEGLCPKLHRDTLGFDGIDGRYSLYQDGQCLKWFPIKPIVSKFLKEITIVSAHGVPIPNKNARDAMLKRNTILREREIRVSLVNNLDQQYGNTLVFKANWSPDTEDVWVMDQS